MRRAEDSADRNLAAFEEAGSQCPVGGQAEAVAGGAERGGHGADEADSAAGAGEAIDGGGADAGLGVAVDGEQGAQVSFDGFADFGFGDEGVAAVLGAAAAGGADF